MTPIKMSQDEAETIGMHAVTYLIQESGLIGDFLAETGLGPKEIKSQVQNPAFLGAVLDFYIGRAELLSAFAHALNIKPKIVMDARYILPGADVESWVLST